MNGPIWLAVIVEVAMVILAVQLFRGKWLNLLAGYNTMSKEEKSKVNGKFVGKVVGSLILFVAAEVIVLVLFPEATMACLVLTVIVAFAAIFYANGRKSRK